VIESGHTRFTNRHHRLDQRLTRYRCSATEARAVDWYAVAKEFDRRTDDCGRLSSLPAEWQRELVALARLESFLSNGGYLLFLANGERESYIYARQALLKIDAHRMAGIVECCQALVEEHFPTEGKSPNELTELLSGPIIGREGKIIKEAGSVLPESILRRISELSWEYMGYPDDVGPLAQSYFGPLISGDKPA
jgi:hypothetical protein